MKNYNQDLSNIESVYRIDGPGIINPHKTVTSSKADLHDVKMSRIWKQLNAQQYARDRKIYMSIERAAKRNDFQSQSNLKT